MKKSTVLLPMMALTALLTVACNKSVNEPEPVAASVSDTVGNVFAFLPAQAPDTVRDLAADTATPATNLFTYYSLSTGAVVPASDSATNKWDIAIRSTTIIINGGALRAGTASALVLNGTAFDSVSEAPATGYANDTLATTKLAIPTGSGNGWYNHAVVAPNTITPKPGVVIVLKTASGKYAKIEILSYYKGNPVIGSTTPVEKARLYTFRYFVQTDGSRNLKPNAAPYTFYSLTTKAKVVDTTTGWDLAFRATSVKVNGDYQLLSPVDFDTLATAPSTFGGGSVSWYDYAGAPNHTITPKLANVLVLKTRANKYAKVQFLSYYKDAPSNPNGVAMDSISRNYTFRFVLQADGTTKLK